MQALGTSDYRGYQWPTSQEDEDEGYPLYVLCCPGSSSTLSYFHTAHL